MNIWDKLDKTLKLFACAALMAAGINVAYVGADTGHEGATRQEVGSYANTRLVVLSNSAATQIAASSTKRPDMTCFNNSSYTIWIGSNAAGASLQRIGFPVLSSATFRVGALTGSLFAILDPGGSGEVNCFDGLVQ